MRRILTAMSFALLMASPAFAAETAPPPGPTTDISKASPGIYVLDKSHASLVFKISHVGYSLYHGRFNDFDASITLKNVAKPAESAVELTVQLGSVDTNNKKLEDELRSDKFMNTTKFPTAKFVSKQITLASADKGTMVGDLTFMGVTKPVTMNVVFRGYGVGPFNKKQTLGFSASTTIKRSEWGFNTYVPAVGDDVQIEFDGEFNYGDAPAVVPAAAPAATTAPAAAK